MSIQEDIDAMRKLTDSAISMLNGHAKKQEVRHEEQTQRELKQDERDGVQDARDVAFEVRCAEQRHGIALLLAHIWGFVQRHIRGG